MATATLLKPAKPPKAAKAPKAKKDKVDPLAAAEAALTDDLRKEIPLLKKKINELTDTSIDLRHEIGEMMVEIIDNKSGRYGTDPEASLYKVMPLSADSIRPMVAFARNYDKGDVRKLRDMRNPVTDERLTWTHIIALTRVPNKPKAFELAEKAIANGWSTKALNKEVIKAAGGKKSKGGRKPKAIQSLAGGLTDVDTKMDMLRNSSAMWLGQGGLSDQFAAETKNGRQITAAEFDSLGKLTTKVDELALTLRQVAMQLGTLRFQAAAAKQKTQKLAS